MLSAFVFAETNQDEKTSDGLDGVVYSNRTTQRGGLSRMPPHADIICFINNNSINLRFNDDYGQGNYRLEDLSNGFLVEGICDTSNENHFEINYEVTDSSSIDFYIEFEDGSWCHLFWDNN